MWRPPQPAVLSTFWPINICTRNVSMLAQSRSTRWLPPQSRPTTAQPAAPLCKRLLAVFTSATRQQPQDAVRSARPAPAAAAAAAAPASPGASETSGPLEEAIAALKLRLEPAVRAELETQRSQQAAAYKRSSARRLQGDGLCLMGLQAAPVERQVEGRWIS